MKKILPVAVLAAMAGVNGAQAVHVNSDGLGQVLLYPYYTTTEGQDTYINLVNTTNDYKAVKVRILESMNSREVLDFNLYLSPQDHWSAVIYADPDGDGAVIRSDDNSCTVPLGISNHQVIPFRNFEYETDSVDGLERTKEGYVEVIEMATLYFGSEDWPADILHIAGDAPGEGVPGDCQDLDDSWNNGGVWDSNPGDGASLPTGGLYGYGVLIDVQEGTDATYDAVALDNFVDPLFGTHLHSEPGDLLPSLASAFPAYDTIIGNNVVSGDTSGNTLPGLDAVSATIIHNAIANDYVLESDIEGGTDWVITFPTKRDYVNRIPALAPFTDSWDPLTSTSCEEFSLLYWDREERPPGAPITSNDFSPQRPETPDVLSLCAEANVLSFNGSNVLEADIGRNGTNLDLEEGFENGWAVMDFVNTSAGRPPLVAGANTFEGLPVIGFAVQKYVNSTLVVNDENVLSNYAGSVSHKAGRSTYATGP